MFGPIDPYGIGLPKDSDGVAFVKGFLKTIEEDGTWAKLWQISLGDRYLQALLSTWRLTAIYFAAAFCIGILITVLRVCPIRPLRLFGDFYVQIFRNIPGAALLILLVYALPYLRIIFSYGLCVLIATTLIPSAFCS